MCLLSHNFKPSEHWVRFEMAKNLQSCLETAILLEHPGELGSEYKMQENLKQLNRHVRINEMR